MKWFLLLVLLVALVWLFLPHKKAVPSAEEYTVTVNGQSLTVELADEPDEITQGLSDRDSMPLGHGMLFVLEPAGIYPFWMNRMHFPLDILWINDGVVVDMVTLPPPKFGEVPRTYTPKNVAGLVLELNAGEAAGYGLRVGSPVDGLEVF
jgi:uncharacterized membrane protein (UPF0127 family)